MAHVFPSAFRRRGMLATLIVLFSVLGTTLAVGAPQRVGYQPYWKFEDQMHKLKEEKGFSCLPKSYSILTEPFWTRAIGKAYDTCVTDNMNADTLAKYIALGAGSLSPAGVYIAPYTLAELKSDGVKCLMKAYVEASNGPSLEDKAKYREWIDTGFQLKDWSGFVTGIPDLKNARDAKQAADAFVNFSLSGTERIQDAGIFADGANSVLGTSYDWMKRKFKGAWMWPSEIELDNHHQLALECRFGNAERSLEKARELAQSECRELGHQYRVTEQELVSSLYRTYDVIGADTFNDDPVAAIHRGEQEDFKKLLAERKKALEDYIPVLDAVDNKKKALEQLIWKFDYERKRYTDQFLKTREALGTKNACYAIDGLRNNLKEIGEECKIQLYRSGPGGASLSPDVLEAELVTVGRVKSAEWWKELDRIRALRNSCQTDAARSAAEALRRTIEINPAVQMLGGVCQEVPQPTIEATLKAPNTPDHCRMTSVPRTIIGLPLAEAARILEAAELFPGGENSKVKPKEGDVPGTVVDSLPVPGSSVRIWSPVQLTIIGEFPKDETPAVELVAVPRLMPSTAGDALSALQTAGLVGAVGEKIPADEIEMVPGNVKSADHATGDMIPVGSTVTLTVIGPRPKIKVPSIAGAKTFEEARSILKGAGFVVGASTDGDPPPEGAVRGAYYATNPPAETVQEMFSTVVPIAYSDMVEMPSVKDKSPQAAGDILAAYGAHFVMGALALSPDRPEGSKLGDVHFSDPPAGNPVPPGTVVTLFVYPPTEEEIGNLKLIPTEIIGLPAGQAAGLLRGADNFFAVPDPEDGDVAQEGQTPGTVQFTAPAVGTLALRGSAVLMFVYTAPPFAESETPVDQDRSDGFEQASDDNSWIGIWKASGTSEQNGKQVHGEARLAISRRSGGLLVKVQPLKDGVYAKGMELQMVVDAHNVLRFDPKILEEMKKGANTKPKKDGVLTEPLEKIVVAIQKILETLEITRDGSNCSYKVVDPKKGLISADFTCIRQ